MASQSNAAALSPEELAELDALIENRYGGETLYEFICRTRPHEKPPKHLLPIIAAFQRAKDVGKVRVCISMPPRAGKSTTVRSAIVWWLSHSPADLCMYVSYNADIAAREHGRKTRDEAERVGISVSSSSAAADDWHTSAGGGMRACGMNAGITGRGATGVCVVDDPFSGFQEGESPVTKEHVWNTFNSDVRTRLEGWASLIVVHTRWSDDDLIGRLETEGWDVISIPAIANDNGKDILGRQPGESFWPEREQFKIENLLMLRAAAGYMFAALFQQSPQGRGRKVFGPPTYYDPRTTNLNGCTAVIGVDPAASEKTSADWSVAVLMAIRNWKYIEKAEAYIVNVLREQETVPKFARHLLNFQRTNWNAPLAVESVGAFKAVPQMLREHAPGLVIVELATPEELHGDKFLRSQGIAGAWNAGRVYVPNNSPPWLEAYLGVMKAFTGVKDPVDDDVDATSHAWNHIVGGPMPVFRGAVEQTNAYS